LLKPTDVVLILYANDMPAPLYSPDLDMPSSEFRRRTERWWYPRGIELIQRAVLNQPIYRVWPHAAVRFFSPVPDRTNPWTGCSERPSGLDPAIYDAMVTGTINPWLMEQSEEMPGMLAHDFTEGGSPALFLLRMNGLCNASGAKFLVAYVPFCGVVHSGYAKSLSQLGMPPATALALSRDPLYRRQNQHLAGVCKALGLILVDVTADLVRAEAAGEPQYWNYDTHPRPAGYATIARRIHRALRGER
jgi:hypothetical protein